MIPARLKLWGFLALAFLAGVIGLRTYWIATGRARAELEVERQRAKARGDALEVERDVARTSDDDVRERLDGWMRDD